MIRHDVFYSLDGFECHSQIEAETSEEATKLLTALLGWLQERGAQSRLQARGPRMQKAQPVADRRFAEENSPGRVDPWESLAGKDTPRCPIHGKAKMGQNGNYYCPTKLEDGSWCRWSARAVA